MGNDTLDQFPFVSIQSDWDDTLMTPGNEVWASYKFKDKPSVQGRVSCVSEGPGTVKYVSSQGFSVKLISQSVLEVDLPDVNHKATLLAPVTSHSSIHTKSISCFDVTSKGVIVSASTDGKLKVWNSDKEGNKFELGLEGHEGEVYKCKFFPSEKVVLSCGSDMTLRIWCALTGQCPVKLVGHTQPVMDCCVVDRGRNVLSVSKDGSAKLWNCGTSECLGDIIKVPSIINCCQIRKAPSALNLGMPHHTLNSKEVGTEGQVLLIGCEDGMVYCVGLQTRMLLFTLSCDSPVNCLAFLSDTKFVVGCQNGKLIIYEISENTCEQLSTWHDSNSAVLCLLPASCENQTSTDNFFASRADGSVTLRPASNASISVYLTGANCDPVYHMTCNSHYIYTACRDSVIRIYDKTTLNKLLKNITI